MRNQRVLVTGATGQIGYMTFKRLLDQPALYDVHGVDVSPGPSVRVPPAWTLAIPEDRFKICDLADFAAVQQAVEGMDVVVHLAADPEGDSWESVLNNNVIATYHVFEA